MDVVHIKAGVRYCEDAEVNGIAEGEFDPKMPFLHETEDGKHSWDIDIDVDTGTIIGWAEKHPDVKTAKTWYKVCDCCGIQYGDLNYYDYVPSFLALDEEGFGDYVFLTILDGKIKGWNKYRFDKFVSHQKSVSEG